MNVIKKDASNRRGLSNITNSRRPMIYYFDRVEGGWASHFPRRGTYR